MNIELLQHSMSKWQKLAPNLKKINYAGVQPCPLQVDGPYSIFMSLLKANGLLIKQQSLCLKAQVLQTSQHNISGCCQPSVSRGFSIRSNIQKERFPQSAIGATLGPISQGRIFLFLNGTVPGRLNSDFSSLERDYVLDLM